MNKTYIADNILMWAPHNEQPEEEFITEVQKDQDFVDRFGALSKDDILKTMDGKNFIAYKVK